MLSRINKIPAELVLLVISLLVLAGLDVLFVAAYEKPDLRPAETGWKFAEAEPEAEQEAEAKVATETEPKDTEELPDDEEIDENAKQLSTEFTPVDLAIPLQTKLKLEPFALKDEAVKAAARKLTADRQKTTGKKKKSARPIYQPKKLTEHRICAKEALTMAVNVRSIQSKLMVAALSCPGAKVRYNRFALKYSRPLKRNADVIMNYFKCSVGRKAVLQFDKTITKIANAAAALNSKSHEDFCDDVAGIFDELEEAEAKDLVNVAKRHFYLDDDFAVE